MNLRLEVIIIPVSDVDRARKRSTRNLGWRLDADFASGRLPRRAADAAQLGSLDHLRQGSHVSRSLARRTVLVLAVDDVDAARDDLIARGVDGERGLPLRRRPLQQRRGEPARRRARSARSFLLLRLPRSRIRTGTAGCSRKSRTRLPGREWKLTQAARHGRRKPCRTPPRDRGAPRQLREDARRSTTGGTGYAPYLSARQNGSSPGGGSRRRRPLHGGGNSCSSPIRRDYRYLFSTELPLPMFVC